MELAANGAQGTARAVGDDGASSQGEVPLGLDRAVWNALSEKTKNALIAIEAGTAAAKAATAAALARVATAEADTAAALADAAKARAALAAERVPVKERLGQLPPMTSSKLVPEFGGDPMGASMSSTTAASAAWLRLTGDDVCKWDDDAFADFLDGASNVKVALRDGSVVPVFDLVMASKVVQMIDSILEGTGLGQDFPIRYDAALATHLQSSVWLALNYVMGNGGQVLNHLPASEFMTTRVDRGNGTFVQVPPQYDAFTYKFGGGGCAVESWIRSGGHVKPAPPAFEGPGDAAQIAAEHCARFVVEVKRDSVYPKAMPQGASPEDCSKLSSHIVDYMTSELFDETRNPAAQAILRGYMTRTRAIGICTGNRMAYGWIESATGATQARFTRNFDWSAPGAPLASRRTWSHFEVLIRFLLASYGSWYLGTFPDKLKDVYKRRNKERTVQEPSEKRRRRGGGGGSRSGGGDQAARGSDAATSTGGSRRMAPSQRTWALERLYWEDLWAPLRFAVPATHPVEVECTTAHLEGDATLLAVGRMGPTYRKTLQGRDVVVKVLAYCVPRDLDGEAGVMPTRLRGELQREVEAYDRLEDLWGVVVPHMLWFGSIVDDMADALATEYVGGPMSRTVTPSLVESAIQALKAIHARGVLHGDAEVKNFCVRPEDGSVFVVD